MEITAVEPEQADVVEALVALTNAAGAVDSPWALETTVAHYLAMMRHGYDGEPPEVYAAYEAGALVGTLDVWTSEWDNTHLAWTSLLVHPEARRRGHGAALLEFARKRAAELGRTSLGCDGWDIPATNGFAQSMGLPRKGQDINRRQRLDRVDPLVVAELYDEAAAAAAAYELVRIAGRTPPDLLDAVAAMAEAINDAPTDDLDIEDEVFSGERVQGYETSVLAKHRRLYRVVARHRETGELAGHSVVEVEEDRPHIGHQGDTSVVRAHRGHRLGLLVKTDMLRWLAEEEPQLESIDTWNAESNDHMIEVNERLGYEILGRGLQFQINL